MTSDDRSVVLAIFREVAGVLYATDGAHEADELRNYRRGDCHAKAFALFDRLSEARIEARIVRWEYQLPATPDAVRRLPSRRDLHTTLEVRRGRRWVLADPTIDAGLAGFLEPAEWDGEYDSTTAFPPVGPIWRDDEKAAVQRCRDSIARDWEWMPVQEQGVVSSAYRVAFGEHLVAVRAKNAMRRL